MREFDTNQSITATVCEQAALFGAVSGAVTSSTPGRSGTRRMP